MDAFEEVYERHSACTGGSAPHRHTLHSSHGDTPIKVTRDVIYDLLPAYFAGEVSADTKALIDEFFASDPEFGRMAQRFGTLQQDLVRGAASGAAVDTEREALEHAKHRFRKQRNGLVWGAAASVAILLVMLTPTENGPTLYNPAALIAFVCTWFAAVAWLSAVKGRKGRS